MRRLLIAIPLVLIAACTKEKDPYDGKEKTVSFVVGEVKYDPSEGAVKVTDHVSGSTHRLWWDAGDQISMLAFKAPSAAGELSAENVVNFSANRFSAGAPGRTATFTGSIPDLSSLGSGTAKLFAIYPACDLSVAASSNVEYGATKYDITGPAISATQDGSGWPYCLFASNDGVINTSTRAVSTSPAFLMANTLIKFGYTSAKNIRRIDITINSQASGGNLAGDVTFFSCYKKIQKGATTATITISNGGALPAEILFACRQITSGRKVTFSFTAEDGSVCIKSLTASEAYSTGNMYNLGTISLSSWTSSESAADAVRNMGVGLNLCGTFDDVLTPSGKSDPDRADISTYETLHGQGLTTQATMSKTAEAGFRCMRIPITWYPHTDQPYTASSVIDDAMLDRIEEVVNYCLNAGMYCIINVHHDGGPTEGKAWLRADWSNYATIKPKFVNLWTQIAERFKDYGPKLLFEGYNEIRDASCTWFQPANSIDYNAANALNQDFVDAVRATGSVNRTRNLLVSTYTASDRENALQNFVMPEDAVPEHLIVAFHSYLPAGFVTANTSSPEYRSVFNDVTDATEIDAMFERVKTYVLDKGWPCVMGEYGAFRKDNDSERARHAKMYTAKALEKGIAPIYWYNPMNYANRTTGTWTYPEVKTGIIEAYEEYLAGL